LDHPWKSKSRVPSSPTPLVSLKRPFHDCTRMVVPAGNGSISQNL
jgi:hypothetical protein